MDLLFNRIKRLGVETNSFLKLGQLFGCVHAKKIMQIYGECQDALFTSLRSLGNPPRCTNGKKNT